MLSFENGTKNLKHDLHDRYHVFYNQIQWQIKEKLHRINGPAIGDAYLQKGKYHSLDSTTKTLNFILWYVNGFLHKVNQPAIKYSQSHMVFYLYGKIYAHNGNDAMSCRNGMVHHDASCAMITGNNFHWKINGKLHREDGPAVIAKDGTQNWYIEGKLHRIDGPAIIRVDGTQEWWNEGRRHREDGPAIIEANGTQEWYLNDELHREDGPAVIYPNGSQEFWINGQQKDI